jgi:putative ABC transport system permease protein
VSDAWRQDLRSALRSLRRDPAFTFAAGLSLALALGAATLTFGLVEAILLRPLPFPAAERLVVVQAYRLQNPDGSGNVSFPELQDFSRLASFASAGASRAGFGLTLEGGARTERIPGEAVSPDLFPAFGVRPLLGRGLRDGDNRREAPDVVLLGYDLWQRRFRGDPGIVGRTLQTDRGPYRVIGVMPPGFRYPLVEQAWFPLAKRLPPAPPRAIRNLSMFARLRPGASLEQAQAEAAQLTARLARRYPQAYARWNVRVLPFREASSGCRLLVRGLPMLLGAVGFIFLIACANLIHLLLGRAAGRRREMAVRAAFGARRGHLARPVLTECALLAACGGAAGTALAAAGLRHVDTLMPHTQTPFWMRFSADGRVLAFALGATFVSWLLASAPAALWEASPDLTAVLQGFARGGGPRRNRLQDALIVSEVAVAAVLLIGAGLLSRSLLTLWNVPSGFKADHLLTVWTSLSPRRYSEPEAKARRAADIVDRLSALPGVESAAIGAIPLYSGGREAFLEIEGRTFPPGRGPDVLLVAVTPGYFRALGAPLLSGRTFTAAEALGRSRVAIVNRQVARYWMQGGPQGGLRGAVGKRFRATLEDSGDTGWLTIVGVVEDIRHFGLRQRPVQTVYLPFSYSSWPAAGVLVRTAGDPLRLLPEVERQIQSADPALPVFTSKRMEDLQGEDLAYERFWSLGFVFYSGVALCLALVGVYGVLSTLVSRQLREVGIRVALGARRADVLRLTVGRGMALVLLGLALGLLGALGVSRLLAPLLYEVSPRDPVSYAGIAILLLDAAFIACWLPTRRALAVDPVEVLRAE